MNAEQRCSDLSERAGERLGATATNAENWFLVEVPGTWPRDVSDAAGLPEPAGDAVRTWLEQTPSSRLLFIRRTRPSAGKPQLAFVVRAGEEPIETRRIELAVLEELAALDFSRAGDVIDSQLVLVCGHGTRDACCALRGTAVYGALAPMLGPEQLWISSHHGGHRFAANVLVLPAAVHLGRVAPDEAPFVVSRAIAGRLDLDHYRGRTAYPQQVQAAERAVREAEGLDGLADLRLIGAEGERVRFRSSDGREHVADVEQVAGPVVPASCGADAAAQPAFIAHLA